MHGVEEQGGDRAAPACTPQKDPRGRGALSLSPPALTDGETPSPVPEGVRACVGPSARARARGPATGPVRCQPARPRRLL